VVVLVDVDGNDDGIADQPIERDLIDAGVPFGELQRRVDVRSVPISGWRVAGELLLQDEALSRRPVERTGVIRMRKIDKLVGRGDTKASLHFIAGHTVRGSGVAALGQSLRRGIEARLLVRRAGIEDLS